MKRLVCALTWIVLLIGLPTLAQGSTLGLSVEHFNLLAAANAAPVNTVAFDFTSHLAVEDLDTFAFQADVNGSGVVDRDAHALGVMLNGAIQPGTTQNIPVDTDIRLIADTLYLNPGDGWQAREGFYQWAAALIYQIVTLDTDADALSQWDLSGVYGFDDVSAAWNTIEPGDFVRVERLADTMVGNVETAHFQLEVDPYALMQTGAFVNLIATLASSQGTPLVVLSPDELTDVVLANSALFEDAALTVDQYIGLDDQFIHRLTLNLNLPVDPSELGFSDGKFTVSADFDATFSGHDQPVTVPVPEGAHVVESFTFPEDDALEPPGEGVTEYVFFETIGEFTPYERSFAAEAGDSVTVTVRGLGLDFDSVASLVSPAGDILGESDDYETAAFGLSGFDPQIADVPIPDTGIYTVYLEEYDGDAGSFVLTITVRR